jgi:hypothetical protein
MPATAAALGVVVFEVILGVRALMVVAVALTAA